MFDPGGVKETRGGAVLILIVILLFALFAIAGLLIDIGMARLTQAHMQSVSDAAALEGGWQLAMGANQTTTRIAVVDRAAEMSESWGPHRIELEDGYNLGGSAKPESSQTINRDTLGDPIRPMLDPNVDNDLEGDIVLGKYMVNEVPDELPGQPVGYDRHAFEPDVIDPNSVLVRLRRTGEDDLAGGTSAERLTYLWSRGSLLDFELKGDGIAVRSESIARLQPVVHVGTHTDREQGIMTATTAAVRVADLDSPTYPFNSLLSVEEPFDIGAIATESSPVIVRDPLVTDWFLPIAKQIPDSTGPWYVVAFTTIRFDGTNNATPLSLAEINPTTINASSNLQLAWDTLRARSLDARREIVETNRSLATTLLIRKRLLHAPVLVRSQQIQGGTP
ncbi:pilus assembly protein TadG-related protein [Rhodopirellula baltica]